MPDAPVVPLEPLEAPGAPAPPEPAGAGVNTTVKRVIRDADNRIVALEEPDRLGDLVTELRDLRDRLDGWVSPGDNLQLNIPAIRNAASKLGIAWPIVITWMAEQDQQRRDAQWGGYCAGYRAKSSHHTHRIVIRRGMTAEQTAANVKHELGHCAQCERYGEQIVALYNTNPAAVEREANELASAIDHIELVRSAR